MLKHGLSRVSRYYMVISSCTASPEAIAICGQSFGTKAALRQAAPAVGVAALSASLLVGGKEVERQDISVSAVGEPTLVRDPTQGAALYPFAPTYGIYGIDDLKLRSLQDLLMARYCLVTPSAAICQNLAWYGTDPTVGTRVVPISAAQYDVNVRGAAGPSDTRYSIVYAPGSSPPYDIQAQSDTPWVLSDGSGRRRWADLPQEVRDAIADTATAEEEWRVVGRVGEVGAFAPPAGYDPATQADYPLSVEISGSDRIFREPAAIPGTSVLERGGPLINERPDRRVGAAYPPADGFVPGSLGEPDIRTGPRVKPLTLAGTSTPGGDPGYKEKKVGAPLPGADGQLDSDDEIAIPPVDVCVAPCIVEIGKAAQDILDKAEDLWEYLLDPFLEDYTLPPGNFFFDIGSSGHPLDRIMGACIVEIEPVPDGYGRFVTNFAISDYHPRNIGLVQFEFLPDSERVVSSSIPRRFRVREEPIQVRGFDLLYSPSSDMPCKAVGWSPRTGIEGTLRVFVKRYQLRI